MFWGHSVKMLKLRCLLNSGNLDHLITVGMLHSRCEGQRSRRINLQKSHKAYEGIAVMAYFMILPMPVHRGKLERDVAKLPSTFRRLG